MELIAQGYPYELRDAHKHSDNSLASLFLLSLDTFNRRGTIGVAIFSSYVSLLIFNHKDLLLI